ncbi:DinB family protein [Wenyingzhuangia sp. IMCC45574]
MNFNLNKSVEMLERTPDAYIALFQNLTYEWDTLNEGANTWNAKNILGHLIHGEKTDWIPRATQILDPNFNETFEPYDRFAQDTLYNTQTTDQLLEEYKALRVKNIATLQSWNLTKEDLDKTGTHPDSNIGTVTLRELISTWTIHDLIHLNQISRVLAKHYSEDMGPWRQYTKLLNQ